MAVPPIFPTDVPTFPTKIIEVEHFIRVSNYVIVLHSYFEVRSDQADK